MYKRQAQTLAQRQSMPEEEMVRALEDLVNSGDLLEILPRRYLAAPLYRKACQSVEQVLAEYHKANPLHAGCLLYTSQVKVSFTTVTQE